MEVIVRNQPSIEIHIEAKVVDSYKTPDSSLSTTSENPVMNKVVTTELNKKLESSDMATINNQPLTGGGNIEVVAESYDDTEIKNKFTELSEKKEDKANKVTAISDESTDNQYPSAKCVHDSLSSLAEEIASNGVLIEDLQNMKIDKENDDYYPNMAVGLADNLAGVDVVDSEINFRRSGGGAISDGVARIESIKGNSLAWNQWFKTDYALSASPKIGGEIVGRIIKGYSKTETAASNMALPAYADGKHYQSIIGHKYVWLFACTNNGATGSIGNKFGLKSGDIWTATTNGYCYIFPFGAYATVIAVNTTFELSASLIDLTKMFGAGNEPTTIEEFYARIPMGVDLNAYNEGEVIHMDVQSIESVGVNAWDEEWEEGSLTSKGELAPNSTQIRSRNFTRVIPNKTYYFKGSFVYGVYFYDFNKKHVATLYGTNTNLQIPSNAMYLKFNFGPKYGITYNHDICINISDPSINGKYFPHIKRVEDLSLIRKYFPDGMKAAGSTHDEIRYNKASGKWEHSKGRLKSVDLGSLNWGHQPISEGYPLGYFSTTINGYKIGGEGLCSKFARSEEDWNMEGWRSSSSSPLIYVKTAAYSDAASFKAAMQGVIFYYEAAEWEWVELDEADQFKDLDYQVWNYGTEKANAEGKSAPLAADITYGFNAIGKIKELEQAIKALQTTVASL